MHASKVWMAAAVLLLLGAAPASFSQWSYRLCFDQILVPALPKIPVGCEVIDCCPGCPGPGPIDWRIRIKGDPVKSVIFSFENVSPTALEQLKITGDAKWIKPGVLRAGRGEVTVRGFNIPPDSTPPIATPALEVDEVTVRKVMDAGSVPENAADFDFSVEQFVGRYPVNEFNLKYKLAWCWPWRYCPPTLPVTPDRIDLDNNAGNDSAVVLMDARRSFGCVDDEIWRGNDIIDVGSVLSNGSCNAEVAVFSDDDAMALITPSAAWTDPLGDLHPVNLSPRLQPQANVWLAIAGTQPRAQAEIFVADLLYNINHAGIGFLTNVNYQDVSGNANAVNTIQTAQANYCTTAWRTALTGSAWYTANQLNVYYVNQAFTGLNCTADRNIIVIGTAARPESLSHEFGHGFSLGHTNGLAAFGGNNIMWGGGTGRTNFTEGQDFRMNVNSGSVLNTNGTRNGPIRNCPDATTSTTCPALALDAVPN